MKTMGLDFEMVKGVGVMCCNGRNSESKRDAGKMILVGLYTGLRKVDLLSLEPDNFKERDGDCFVIGTAQKTKEPFDFPIPKFVYDEVMDDISLPSTIYHRQRSHLFLNRWMDTLFAKEKRRIKAQYGNSRTISPHSLRKTFGLRVYETRGVNSARQALQHKDLATTTRYLEIEARKLEDDLRSMW